MGGSGWSIELERIEGATPACWVEVREGTMQFLWDAWRAVLSASQLEKAWEWVSFGEDSLLKLGDQPEDQPIDKITFWFSLSDEWALELAEHWLHMALLRERPRFDAMLRKLGYCIAEDAEYPVPADGHRFVVDGERIGHSYDDGMFWALPSYEWQRIAALAEVVRQRVEAVQAGGPCQCPYCV